MYILCIGDSHIPKRANEIPEKMYEKLNNLTLKELFDYTLFTGDLVKFPELIDFLKTKTKRDLLSVMGNMDYYYGNTSAPLYQALDVAFEDTDKISIGLTHGAQISPRGDHAQLEKLAIDKEYNILISGHTHKEEIVLTKNGILLLNPGSVTGAWSFVASRIPSFIELCINESTKEINVNLIQMDKKSRELNVLNYQYFFQDYKIKKRV
jgi:putative phosphoesterase